MTRFFLFLAVASVLVACGGSQKPASPTGGAPAVSTTGGSESAVIPAVVDLGDLEQGVVIQATIADADRPANADVQELVDMRENVSLATVNLSEPFPEELWVTVQVRAYRNFSEAPAALRIHVKRDDTTLATYGTVIGRLATGSEKRKEMTWRVNVLEGLEEMPDTTLIVAETELLLMPLGTVEETVDPMTADTDPIRKTKKPSNPLRLNFETAPGSPS